MGHSQSLSTHEARAHLEPVRAAGDGGEDVVAVHGAEDELVALPQLGARRVAALQPRAPALQAAHADRGEEAHPPLRLHLDAGGGVLPRRDEEGAVDQRIPGRRRYRVNIM